MAKQFDPRRVLRQVSNDLLRRFFTARGELAQLDWASLGEADVQPLFEAWQALAEPQCRAVQLTLQEVNELADERSLAVLAEEVAAREPAGMADFAAIDGRVDKAMWVYLTVPLAFAEAARFAQADTMAAGRYWHRRDGLPRPDKPLAVTDEVKARLADELRAFYPEAQDLGHWCHVEHYRRANGSEYFFAYLDDYPDAPLVFDGGAMGRRLGRGAFDNVFVYCPADGTLETYCRGGWKVRRPLEDLFAGAVLGAALGPEGPGEAAYALDG